MAKSWGARIVGRLFGSRSNKKADAEGDETPNLEDSVKDSILQHHSEPCEKLSTKDSDQFSAQIRPETRDEAAPTKGISEAQLNAGKPGTREMPTLSVEPGKENADEPATPLSNSVPMPKRSQVRAPKSQGGRLTDKSSGVGKGTATGETSDGQSVVSNGRPKQKPDHGAQRKVTNKVPTKGRSKADIKVSTNIEPENRAQELVSAKDTVAAPKLSRDWDLLKVGQRREQHSAIQKAPTSALKRSSKPKPRAMDEQVTDEELAELEAENARLKLLLREKLNAEFSS